MKHPHIRTGRSLLGLTLILLGLSTYGCGDSVTVTEPAALGNLSVSEGTLDPQFNPATTSYLVQLSADVSSTTITASPQVAGDTIRIDNQLTSTQTITLDSPGAEQSVNIVVTETGTGGTSRSYTVRVKRASLAGDNSLSNLTVSPGTLAPPFDKNSLPYTVSVGNNIERISVTPTLSDPLATMTVNGQPAASGQARTINLSAGGQVTTITITVTAQDESTKSYVVAVSRGESNNNNLSALTVSQGTLTFRATTTAYTVNVGSNVERVAVRATLADTTATMTVNGLETTSGQSQTIGLGIPGSRTVIPIIIIAQNGALKTYTVNIDRAALNGNNNLSALTVSPGSLDSAFSANDLSYTVNVGSDVPSVRVRPTLADTTATVTVNGQAVTSGQQSGSITLNPAGQSTTIQIVVTALNQTTKTYSVIVIRAALNGNNNLSALTVSPGSLDSAFSANDLSYTVNVGSDVPSVRVRPTLADTTATVTVNGQAVTSGQQSGSITLNPAGQSTTIQIVVTALNQTTKTYSVIVIRAALGGNFNLQSLTVPSHTLSPTFSQTRTRTDYDLEVNSSVDSITVSATPQDSGASVRLLVNNAPSTNPISLSPGPSTTEIEIIVRAPNAAEKSYFITVSRTAPSSNANLSALSVTAGSTVTPFSSPFASNTVTVAPEVAEVVVRATKDDANATMAIGGATISPGTASGQATFTLNGAGGTPTPISFTVTAQNGVDIKTYTISVIRPAAPTVPDKPATAPDLLTADDSCPLDQLDTDNDGITDECFGNTSNTDNITTVKRPGFSVPTPGSGQTAKLYIKRTSTGEEFPSSSTPAGNTLIFRPNADLPDGVYDVTYTLSNSVGESDKSPTLNQPGPLEINTVINN